jgi:hypothetical protein
MDEIVASTNPHGWDDHFPWYFCGFDIYHNPGIMDFVSASHHLFINFCEYFFYSTSGIIRIMGYNQSTQQWTTNPTDDLYHKNDRVGI